MCVEVREDVKDEEGEELPTCPALAAQRSKWVIGGRGSLSSSSLFVVVDTGVLFEFDSE